MFIQFISGQESGRRVQMSIFLTDACVNKRGGEIAKRIWIEIELNTISMQHPLNSKAHLCVWQPPEKQPRCTITKSFKSIGFQVILRAGRIVNGEFVGTNFSARLTVAMF